MFYIGLYTHTTGAQVETEGISEFHRSTGENKEKTQYKHVPANYPPLCFLT